MADPNIKSVRNPTFASYLAAEMRKQKLTVRNISIACGVDEKAVRKWPSGETVPEAKRTKVVAETLNKPPLRIEVLCGRAAGTDHHIELIEHLGSLNEKYRALIGATATARQSSSGLPRLVQQLVASGEYSFRVVPWWRGTSRRRHYADWIVFDPISPKGGEAVRQELLEEEFSDSIANATAWWDGPENYAHIPSMQGLSEAEEQLVLNVPRFVADRRGSHRTKAVAPRDIVVLGGHWCGHADTARFLAERLDYDYRLPMLHASIEHRVLPQRWDAQDWYPSRLDVIHTFGLRAPLTHRRVWAVDYWDDAETVEVVVGSPHKPYVVLLEASEGLLEYAATRRQELGHCPAGRSRKEDLDIMTAARESAREIVEAIPDSERRIMTIDVADGAWPDTNGPTLPAIDQWFDHFGQTAEKLYTQLPKPAC